MCSWKGIAGHLHYDVIYASNHHLEYGWHGMVGQLYYYQKKKTAKSPPANRYCPETDEPGQSIKRIELG